MRFRTHSQPPFSHSLFQARTVRRVRAYFVALVLFAILVPPHQAHARDWFAGASQAWQTYQILKSEGKMPALARDGVLIPEALLLDKIRESIGEKSEVTVEKLVLRQNEGELSFVTEGFADARLTVKFSFGAIDWKKRTLMVNFNEQVSSASNNLLGQLFGGMVIGVVEAATGGKHVETALAKLPYFQVQGKQMAINLEQIPQLKNILNRQIAGYPIFDNIGITQIRSEQGQLRVRLGLV